MRSKYINKVFELMSRMRFMGWGCFVFFIISFFHFFITSCTSDEVGPSPEEQKEVSIEVMSSSAKYEEVDAVTRATTPNWMPNGYTEEHVYLAYGVFFTKSEGEGTVTKSKLHYGADKIWRMTGDINAGDYYLYGYMPYDAGNVTIEPNGTYANGAIMTFTGLSAAMSKDFCIITGAKDAKREPNQSDPTKYDYFFKNSDGQYKETWMKEGDFKCSIKAGENNNILFFLFDHLYAALRLRFRVDETYNVLRDVRLKKIELGAYTNPECTNLMPKLKTTVTLTANSSNTSPIVEDITFTPDGSSEKTDPIIVYWKKEDTTAADNLPCMDGTNKKYTDNLGYVPKTGNANYYKLTTDYEIYDKKGNWIRSGTAVNILDPAALFNQPQLLRAHMYELKLTIGPTFLYVMSDDDLEFKMEFGN